MEEALDCNSIYGGAKSTQEADNVLLLQQEEVMEGVKRKYIEVVKNRYSGDVGRMSLHFRKESLTMSKLEKGSLPKKTKKSKKEPEGGGESSETPTSPT